MLPKINTDQKEKKQEEEENPALKLARSPSPFIWFVYRKKKHWPSVHVGHLHLPTILPARDFFLPVPIGFFLFLLFDALWHLPFLVHWIVHLHLHSKWYRISIQLQVKQYTHYQVD